MPTTSHTTRTAWTAIIGAVAAFCSISGITILAVIGYFRNPGQSPFEFLSRPYAWLASLLIVSLVGLWWTTHSLRKEIVELQGRTVTLSERSRYSRSFVATALRRVDILAGDLSWLEEDLLTYRDLRSRGVEIRILTDTPGASAVVAGKAHGIQFKAYPGGIVAPIKASICDSDEEAESKVLLVKRQSAKAAKQLTYSYWMKEYYGRTEGLAVRAIALLFEALYARGTVI